jgi:Transposase and inactivated derivatives
MVMGWTLAGFSYDSCIHDCYYQTRELANKVLFEYIEIYYNRLRRHSANGWISPQQYERQYYQNNKIIAVSTV